MLLVGGIFHSRLVRNGGVSDSCSGVHGVAVTVLVLMEGVLVVRRLVVAVVSGILVVLKRVLDIKIVDRIAMMLAQVLASDWVDSSGSCGVVGLASDLVDQSGRLVLDGLQLGRLCVICGCVGGGVRSCWIGHFDIVFEVIDEVGKVVFDGLFYTQKFRPIFACRHHDTLLSPHQ